MELYKSNDGKHKYYIIHQGKKISFGAKNYMDYTLYYKKYGKELADKKNSGIDTAGFWSRWLLWNKTSIKTSYEDIKNRFLMT